MNKKFCVHCNAATFYEDKLPKGCSNCLAPFDGAIASARPKPAERREERKYSPQAERLRRTKQEEIEEENYDDPITEFEVPEIQIESLPDRGTEKIGNLATLRVPKEKINRQKVKINKSQLSKSSLERSLSNEVNRGTRKSSLELGANG